MVADIHRRIHDELEDLELWQVSSEHLKYLTPDPLKLDGKFGATYRDAEEAGKCLAYDRGTACVFHLMRIMECGLRALGVSLNDSTLDPKTNPTWEKILGRCDREMQKPLGERADEWKQDEGFYSTATANLRAVKDAWRNPTLHVERDYTPKMLKTYGMPSVRLCAISQRNSTPPVCLCGEVVAAPTLASGLSSRANCRALELNTTFAGSVSLLFKKRRARKIETACRRGWR